MLQKKNLLEAKIKVAVFFKDLQSFARGVTVKLLEDAQVMVVDNAEGKA